MPATSTSADRSDTYGQAVIWLTNVPAGVERPEEEMIRAEDEVSEGSFQERLMKTRQCLFDKRCGRF
jgi:hypothetical protein